jgi:peptidoglycan/LPS O-acetylase OafA/YrhL
LFFVLSGFLITYRYYEHAKLSGNWFFNYFTRRFARIYPIYFLILTVVVLLLKNFNTVFLLQNYTLTHYLFFLFPSHGMAITTSWSLTVEECFYLLAPFIFVLSKRYNFWLPFIITIILLAIILLTYGKSNTDIFLVFSGSFFGCFLKFYAGVYLALMVLKKEKKGSIYIAGQKRTTIGIAGIALLLLPLVYATNKPNAIQYMVITLVNNFIMPFVIAVFYYGLICENSLVKRLLSGDVMRLFGRSSYAFYLLHLPLITYLATPFIKPYFNDSYYNWYVLTVFFITLMLSVALFVFYEDPLNISIRKRLQAFTRK